MGACPRQLRGTCKVMSGTAWLEKSTTYTVVRKMCEKGYIANEDATVSVLIPKEQVQAEESRYLWIAHLTDHCQGLSQHFLEERKFPKRSKAAQENDRRA